MQIMWMAICCLLPQVVIGQEFDKKAYCSSLRAAMSAFEASYDSLKGEYVGANSYGIQQWKTKVMLSGAKLGTYDYSTYLTEEYRATYVMLENAKKSESAALYKQLVQATRSCYGMDLFLEEKVSTEHRGGVKVEQLEAEFTRSEWGRGTGHQYPYIRISSTAYETGETFEVLVELIAIQ